ncbi:hypothetical protein [Nocardia callitridis]|uniref:Secreted protein n=1 Tax=Nocardia callitridis TaxID=648753 RepID=A0ABP9KUH5_9NOCA
MLGPSTPARVRTAALGAATILCAVIAPATAAPSIDTGSSAQPTAVVGLNDYCENPGATATVDSGRTVYCSRVQGTDSYVWSYSASPMGHDPNDRGYTCGSDGCRWPDGSEVPDYRRCGLLCGEPPTSGDVQSGLADCFNEGTDFEECERRVYQDS